MTDTKKPYDGATELMVLKERGRVVLRFPEPKLWVAMDPENARLIAEAIARAAYETRFGLLAPINGRSALSTHMRDKLARRIAIVMQSLIKDGRDPVYIATQLVEIVFKEVA